MENQNKTLENAFEELNDIIKKMDQNEISLDDSFKLYHDGINLVQFCNEKIEKIEKQMIIFNENGENSGI